MPRCLQPPPRRSKPRADCATCQHRLCELCFDKRVWTSFVRFEEEKMPKCQNAKIPTREKKTPLLCLCRAESHGSTWWSGTCACVSPCSRFSRRGSLALSLSLSLTFARGSFRRLSHFPTRSEPGQIIFPLPLARASALFERRKFPSSKNLRERERESVTVCLCAACSCEPERAGDFARDGSLRVAEIALAVGEAPAGLAPAVQCRDLRFVAFCNSLSLSIVSSVR